MLEFCGFYTFCCVLSENCIFLIVLKVIRAMETNISNCCCCCCEYFPPRGSKKLIEVGEKLQSLVRSLEPTYSMVMQPQIPASLIRSVKIVKLYLLVDFVGEQQRSIGGKIAKVNQFWNDY